MYAYFTIGFFLAGLGLFFLYQFQKKKGREKSILFYGSIAHILVGLPLLPSWFVYIGIGFIIAGLILLTLHKTNLPKSLQVILIVLPMMFFLSFNFYHESSYNIILIPKGYTGRIVIVHDCKDGTDKEFEGRYRVYRISPNGLLKTKFSFAGSSFDHLHSQFFYVDSNGTREPIPDNSNEKEAITVYGLWTLPYEKSSGTNLDFIVDKQLRDPYTYKPEENANWQKEIDSCRD
jgi:hypothetical protein